MSNHRLTGPNQISLRPFGVLFGLLAFFLIVITQICNRQSTISTPPVPVTPVPVQESPPVSEAIPLPATDQRLCTGIAVLIDTSGSMGEPVRDRGNRSRPKYQIAREALQRIIAYTGEWKKTHADRALQLGLYSFSSSPSTVLPMSPFDLAVARTKSGRIPSPAGGTAIGEALITGFQALYESGCTRKYIVCITDGQNTTGPVPDRVARELHAQTHGEVELHFVAFDTSRDHFGFLSQVNGNVVEAADGEQLEARLSEIYEKRILAETMPAEK